MSAWFAAIRCRLGIHRFAFTETDKWWREHLQCIDCLLNADTERGQ